MIAYGNNLPGHCGQLHHSSPAVCTLVAGHAGPHQAQGFSGRVVEEWTPAADTEAGAA